MGPAAAALSAAVVVSRWWAFGAPSVREVVGSLVAVALIGLLVGFHWSSERPLTAAGVVVACPATVLVAAADGRWQGIAALVLVALAAATARTTARLGLAVAAPVVFVLWWRAGFDRGEAPGPSWREVAGATGATLRRSLASVGVDEVPVPWSGVFAWCLAVGVVVGAVLVGRRPWRVVWLPVGVAVFVLTVWAVGLFRGGVDPVAGSAFPAVGIALVAAGTGGGRRQAVVAMLLSATGWVVAVVHEVRPARPEAAWALVVGAVAVAALAGAVVSGRVGRARVA